MNGHRQIDDSKNTAGSGVGFTTAASAVANVSNRRTICLNFRCPSGENTMVQAADQWTIVGVANLCSSLAATHSGLSVALYLRACRLDISTLPNYIYIYSYIYVITLFVWQCILFVEHDSACATVREWIIATLYGTCESNQWGSYQIKKTNKCIDFYTFF